MDIINSTGRQIDSGEIIYFSLGFCGNAVECEIVENSKGELLVQPKAPSKPETETQLSVTSVRSADT